MKKSSFVEGTIIATLSIFIVKILGIFFNFDSTSSVSPLINVFAIPLFTIGTSNKVGLNKETPSISYHLQDMHLLKSILVLYVAL